MVCIPFCVRVPGPTLKMRRPVIQNMYARTIAAFYDDNIPAV